LTHFRREILKNVFDEQVDALVAFVYDQIKDLHFRRPGEKVVSIKSTFRAESSITEGT